MKRFFPLIRTVLFLVLYALVTLYTLTFPTSVAWFLFYSFTALLVISFLSARAVFRVDKVTWKQNEDNTVAFSVHLRNKRNHLFFLSSLSMNLVTAYKTGTYYSSALFTRRIEGRFSAIDFPRGHHDAIELDLLSYGLFGIWSKSARLTVPIDIDVYPEELSKSDTTTLLKQVRLSAAHSDRSPVHEFYVKEIRTFQNRDAFSKIDWKSSFKREQWMVKDYEMEEDAPVALCFLGTPSIHFEHLLSIAYSLYTELGSSQKVQLFLIGNYSGVIELGKTSEHFLTIQPVEQTKELASLWQSVMSCSNKVIIKSQEATLSIPNDALTNTLIIDESYLSLLKGGQMNDE